jgi:uncharacterized protein (TIGR03435 family)
MSAHCRTLSHPATVLFTLLTPCLAAGAGAAVGAQSAADTFETASIKPNRSGDVARSFNLQPGGTVRATNIPVRHLIRFAYGVYDFQIVGGSGWPETERYDVIAKASGNPTPERLRAMLRHLLADRFRLDVDETTRELPVYRLVRSTPGGEPGAQLRAATGDCAVSDEKGCGAQVGDGSLNSRGISMTRLAGELSGFVERIIHDRTGLTGNFEVSLTWSPSLQADDNRTSLFTSLQEQLGLKLESALGSVPAIVIRRVERPTEN